MGDKNKTILVIGATGKQGGAVTCRLLSEGWHVRALARDPNKPAVQALAKSGVEVVMGDLDSIPSLDKALQGVYGVFSVQTFMEHGPAGEVIQGKALADAARTANVEHFIYSSVGGAERNSGIPHFESKWEIEQYVRARGLPATILRPVFFMENFISMLGSSIQQGTLRLALHPETRLQMIATDDIGGFVALAFERSREFMGKALEIAGDELTMTETAQVFGRVLGRPVRFVEQPIEELHRSNEDMAMMMQWLNEKGLRADIPMLRTLYPQLMTFETWLRKSNKFQVS